MAQQTPVAIKQFDALSLRELHACLKLRGEVFVVGQQICAVPDVDDDDPLCHHAMLWVGEELVGTARLLPKDDGQTIKVGRVAVGQAWRGRGMGVTLMRGVQDWIGKEPGRVGVMSAQAYLERWYAALGWVRVGEVYEEAGVEHVEMRWSGDKDRDKRSETRAQ
ncbi:MAG: GNAT family N-acetyltransferase [Planctomycetota bacterium]